MHSLRTAIAAMCIVTMGAACGTSGTDSNATATSERVSTTTTTTSSEVTTTLLATEPDEACNQATQDTLDAMDALLDRADVDPDGIDSDALETIFRDLGESMGASCGEAQLGEGLSTVIVDLSNQAPVRSSYSQSLIAGILDGLCPFAKDYELTPAAKVACS